MIMKYRKKPVVIKAVQWTGDNGEESIISVETMQNLQLRI